MCRERDSNPHDRFGSRDFKSLVSTNSTIAAFILRSARSCIPSVMKQYELCVDRGSNAIIGCKVTRFC